MMKKILILLIPCLFIHVNIYSQSYWGRIYGGDGSDEATAVDIDHSHGDESVTVGNFTGSAHFDFDVLFSSGPSDIFISKNAAGGTSLWNKRFGGGGIERVQSVSIDASGNIFICGYFSGEFLFGATTYTSFGLEDVFIAKLDASGNPIWFTQEGGLASDMAYSVKTDPDGNVVITGEFSGVADFGGTLLTALQEDIFIAKYNGNTGNMLWIQQGKADFSDRGTAICTDQAGNVYVTGQFSDTITFDIPHEHNLYNAIYVIKFDKNGNEQWFRAIAGGVTNFCYDIESDHAGYIYITGDFTGILQFLSPISQTLTNSFTNKVFIAKLTTSGSLDWARADGSESEVTSRSVDVKNNKVMFTGSFKCTFDEYSDVYGSGIFNSVGFWDCFASAYDINGNFLWARQWASKKNDWSNSIAIDNNELALVAGSNEEHLRVPYSILSPFDPYPVESAPSSMSPVIGYCGDPSYAFYIYFAYWGYGDAFAGKLANPNRSPYDYYFRENPSCDKDFVPVCIGDEASSECSDTLITCKEAVIKAYTNGVGPDYQFNWNVPVSTQTFFANTTGYYAVTITTADHCYSSTDSLYLIVNPNPPDPLISDNIVINDHSANPDAVNICSPDSVMLTGSPVGDPDLYASYQWTGGGINDSTINAGNTYEYWFTVTDTNGCWVSNSIRVYVHNPILPIVPDLICIDDTDLNDTVDICINQPINWQVIDLETGTGCLPSLYGHCIINNTPSFSTDFSNDLSGAPCSYFIMPHHTDTLYTLACHLMHVNLCDTFEYDVYDTIFIHRYPLPPASISLTGPESICPGDTAIVTCTSSAPPEWIVYPAPFYTNGLDTLYIIEGTSMAATIHVIDSNGCENMASASLSISTPPSPHIYGPSLICPDDSIYFMCLNGPFVTYEWHGPGAGYPPEELIYTSVPGIYYLSITDTSGCQLNSNTIELIEYTVPDIVVTPNNFICDTTEYVTLTITSSSDGLINWIQPVWGGDSVSIEINHPGTYICDIGSCGISTIDSVIISMDTNRVNILADSHIIVCEHTEFELVATPGYSNYIWFPLNETGETIMTNVPGIYTVMVIDEYGCELYSPPIEIEYFPSTALPPDTNNVSFCPPNSVMLSATGLGSIHWFNSPSSTTILHIGNNYITPVLDTTTVYYVSSSNDSCTSERIPVYAIALSCDTADMPNVFTPNGDGMNDGIEFNIIPYNTCFKVIIYNRWGEEVNQSEYPDFIWYGTNVQGEPLNDGVYFYLIQYCVQGQLPKLKNGFIHLYH